MHSWIGSKAQGIFYISEPDSYQQFVRDFRISKDLAKRSESPYPYFRVKYSTVDDESRS